MTSTITDFEVGVLLSSATDSIGMRRLDSGKYVAMDPTGIC